MRKHQEPLVPIEGQHLRPVRRTHEWGLSFNARDGIMEVGVEHHGCMQLAPHGFMSKQSNGYYTLVQVLFDSTVVRFGLRWTDRRKC